MALAGYPIEQIASQMHRAHKTIQNYLNPDFSVTNGHYNVRIPGKLAPYENEVIKLRSQGLTYPQIHDIICKNMEKLKSSFPTFCKRTFPQLHKIASYAHYAQCRLLRKPSHFIIYSRK